MALLEVARHATNLNQGEVLTAEEAANRGADVQNCIRKGVLVPVGFLSKSKDAPTEAEVTQRIADMQKKMEDAEDLLEMAQQDLKERDRRIHVLEAGHEEGSRQLAEALAKLKIAEARVAEYEAKAAAEKKG